MAYLRLRKSSIQEIWKTAPESFYAKTASEINTFSGVAEATMCRDEGWHFLQLGRFIERAQCSTALLLSQLAIAKLRDVSFDADWTSLLRVFQAYDAYNRNYSVDVQPRLLLDLLVTDPLLQNSLCCSLEAAAAELNAIGPGPQEHSSAAARRMAGRLSALIQNDWPDREDHKDLLGQIRASSWELHDLVITAYINYAIEDSPVR